METDTNTPHSETDEGTPEAVLAARLNIPRLKFKQWREDGALKLSEHWIKDGQAFVILAAGVIEVERLLGLPPAAEKEPNIQVIALTVGVYARILRGKVAQSSQPCSVRLTAPRVFARQFRRGEKLNVKPTATPGIFEYDGAPGRRVRI